MRVFFVASSTEPPNQDWIHIRSDHMSMHRDGPKKIGLSNDKNKINSQSVYQTLVLHICNI